MPTRRISFHLSHSCKSSFAPAIHLAASVVKSCDLDHKPNHSGPGFITAPPSPHDSAAGCERAIFLRFGAGGAASIWLGSIANMICSFVHALHGRRPYLRAHGNVTVPAPRMAVALPQRLATLRENGHPCESGVLADTRGPTRAQHRRAFPSAPALRFRLPIAS